MGLDPPALVATYDIWAAVNEYLYYLFLRKVKLLWILLVYTCKPTSCCHFCTFQNPTRDHSISQTTGLVNRRKYSHNLEMELLPRKLRKQLACPSGLGSSSFP